MSPTNRFASHWTLDPSVAYLNHGSFGACPRAVLDVQASLRERLEREPCDFLWRDLPGLLAGARAELGSLVGADPDDLAFVPNATTGVNAVLRSLRLEPGDEILTTDHVYPACRKAIEWVAARTGAKAVVASVPFPIRNEEEVVAPVLASVSPRTRLALLDHVTSSTGLVFPLERLVRELAARGVDTLVDGAHAPGMVPLDLGSLGAAYYAANAHKWLCAPKGAAFLHVRRDRRRLVHPVVISHGYEPDEEGDRFRAEFDWTGTLDPTAWLAIPASIRHLASLVTGGWPEVMRRNRELVLAARDVLLGALGVEAPAPPGMLGALASIPLPAPAPGSPVAGLPPDGLSRWFRERGVETVFFRWPGPAGKVVRLSAQLYNDPEQYERLAGLLVRAIGES